MRRLDHHGWTPQDDATLVQLTNDRVPIAERARRLGMSEAAVRSRLTRLRRTLVDDSVDIPIHVELPVDPVMREHVDMEAPKPIRAAGPETSERLLFVPDTHAPFVDDRAWGTMIAAARRWRPHRIFVLGDMADFYAVSDHDKSPARRQNLKWEVSEVNKRLDELDTLGATHKHFVAGNHEARLQRHLAKHAPALFDMFDVKSLFRLDDRRWSFTDYGDSFHVGHLYVTHDEDNAGQYAHIKARATFEGNVVIGHTHRMATHYQGNAKGESHVGAMFGWLGDLGAIDYAKRVKAQQWQHGFGIGHLFDDGDVHLQGVPIVSGRCVVDGSSLRVSA